MGMEVENSGVSRQRKAGSLCPGLFLSNSILSSFQRCVSAVCKALDHPRRSSDEQERRGACPEFTPNKEDVHHVTGMTIVMW